MSSPCSLFEGLTWTVRCELTRVLCLEQAELVHVHSVITATLAESEAQSMILYVACNTNILLKHLVVCLVGPLEARLFSLRYYCYAPYDCALS